MDLFLDNYPGTHDNPSAKANLEFYSNRALMQPDELRYEEFMTMYERDLQELETNQYVASSPQEYPHAAEIM